MKVIDVLIVEDSAALAQAYIEYLHDEPLSVSHVSDGESAMEVMQGSLPRMLVLDLMLPDMNGMHILQHIHDNELPIDVIVASGHGSMEDVVEAMQQGAVDFLEKPFTAKRFVTTVKNVLERGQLKTIVNQLTDKQRKQFQGFIGSSVAMQLIYQTIEQVALSSAPVFISGESGTGKEVCADAIHACSDRNDKPFIALNCAAIPRDLVESEIFGHVKGAFTGAVKDRDGAAAQANGGTLFLDEIAEMDIDLQAKLLRFIQTQSFQKVGGSKLEKVDVRFVCATNKNALEQVEKGQFREDLYYRLNVINIDLPPLRNRDNDVLDIADFFLKQFAEDENKAFLGLSQDAQKKLLKHEWPGNVRELQNVMRRVVVMNKGGKVSANQLEWQSKPKPLGSVKTAKFQAAITEEQKTIGDGVNFDVSSSVANASNSQQSIRPLADIEREAIEHAIAVCDGNIPKAAVLLDVSPSTIYRKIQAWEIA